MAKTPYFGKKIFAGSYRCPKTPILVIFSKKSLKIAKNAKKIAKNSKTMLKNRQKYKKNAQNRHKCLKSAQKQSTEQ